MKTIFHSAASRGSANHGWLNAKHSFSFASWYNPDRVNFGALRVLNDDIVAAGGGFGTHPHDNMEIITIPLSGSLKHQDSMGNSSVIQAGEIQVMSAGTGIQHSEFNPSNQEELTLFQIWIFPNKRNVTPRYDQFVINYDGAKNNFLQLVSPNQSDEGTWVHQNAWIHLAQIEEGKTISHKLNQPGNGTYFMVIEGRFQIGEHTLEQKDALGVWETDTVEIISLNAGRILAIEIPMEFD
jgi:redox-sensitive bicupin YhaK (pirin superfamily)